MKARAPENRPKERMVRNMKKWLAALLTLALLAAGCTGAMAEEKTELLFKHLWNGDQAVWLDEKIAQFNASQDRIVVRTEYVPFDDMNTQIAIDIASGGIADLYAINNPEHASYVDMGLLADITDYLADWEDMEQFYERSVASCQVDGRLYGLPAFDTNCLALFYNKTVLEEAGIEVPTTMEELYAACEQVTDASIGRYGLTMSAIDAEDGTFQFIPFLYAFGGDVYDVDSEGSVAALQYLVDLIENGYMSREVINFKQGDALTRWLAGQAVFMINGSWNLNSIRTTYDPELGWEWSVALIPAGPAGQSFSCMGGKNIGVGATEHVEEAVEFLKFISGKDVMLEFATQFGAVPNRADVAADPYWASDYEANVFVEQMDSAVPRGPHKDWAEISQAIRTATGSAMSGNSTAADALAVAAQTIDGILQG